MTDPAGPDLDYLGKSMEQIPCPICGHEEYHQIAGTTGRKAAGENQPEISIVICEHCTHVYMNPRPSIEAYNRFYHEDDYSRVSYAAKGKVYNKEDRWKQSEEIVAGRKQYGTKLYEQYLRGRLSAADIVFDFGCGPGAWLVGLQEAVGCQVVGNEPSIVDVEFTREKLGLDILLGPVELLHDEILESYEGRVSLCIISGSMQHILTPSLCLGLARSILKDGGYLYVCNHELFVHSLRNKPLDEYVSIDHVNYFHENSYRYLAQQFGFEIAGFKRDSTIRPRHMEMLGRKVAIPADPKPERDYNAILADLRTAERKGKRRAARKSKLQASGPYRLWKAITG